MPARFQRPGSINLRPVFYLGLTGSMASSGCKPSDFLLAAWTPGGAFSAGLGSIVRGGHPIHLLKVNTITSVCDGSRILSLALEALLVAAMRCFAKPYYVSEPGQSTKTGA
jgi:hypothetical protein